VTKKTPVHPDGIEQSLIQDSLLVMYREQDTAFPV
jgi:hypothetical protein